MSRMVLLSVLMATLAFSLTTACNAQGVDDWSIHSTERPNPPVVDPGPAARAASPPSDAIVLFDGSDLTAWRSRDGGEAGWRIRNDAMEVVPGAGEVRTAQPFGDVQMHIEWSAPAQVSGSRQNRGNSGVFFGGGRYEVQILDSYENETYADGQAAAIYGQYPPLVNAMRPPGQWNTYDIVYRAPRFHENGDVLEPAYITVFHNGVLVQDNEELTGPTAHRRRPPYQAHDLEQYVSLQDHGDRVRFRNIWVRELADRRER